MAWFGESLANITGQISNFTKEVLTESREDGEEAVVEQGDVSEAKHAIQELQSVCNAQKQEIERLKIANYETLEQIEMQERQVKSRAEAIEQLLINKEEENKRLREQVDTLLEKQHQQKAEAESQRKNNEDAASSSVMVVGKETICVATNTEEEDEKEQAEIEIVGANVSDAAVGDGSVEGNDNEELLDEKLELEERCNGYQNDLFLLREELMTLQHGLDEREIASTKLMQDIFNILSCEFLLDGQQVMKLKSGSHHFTPADEDVIISALRQLASIWRDLVDRKATLERTVAKLSNSSVSSSSSSSVVSSSSSPPHHHSPLCLTPSVDQADYGTSYGSSASGGGSSPPTILANTFLPAKVDSFVLETILEDETGEEEVQNVEGEEEYFVSYEPENIAFAFDSKSSRRNQDAETQAGKVELINNSSQTDELQEKEIERRDEKLIKEKSEEVEEEARKIQEQRFMELVSEEKSRGEQILAEKIAELRTAWDAEKEHWKRKVEEGDERIMKLEGELHRLRNHLVELEEQATNDAVVSEEREQQLRIQLAHLKTQIAQNLEENDKIGDVREELSRLASERDEAKNQSSAYEEQIHKQGVQLQNLHFVLEQFQKEKVTEIGNLEKMLRHEINQLMADKEALSKEIRVREEALEKARSGLEAAQNLGAQIEEKTRIINSLKAEVSEKEKEMDKMNIQIKEVGATLDGKIDRYLVKNLIVGYFATPNDKRKEVLRVLATVLDFNREDRQKTGLEATSIWPFSRGGETSAGGGDKQSLSEAFIHFLETESQPKVQLRLSAEEMSRRSSRSSISSNVGGESPGPSTPIPGGNSSGSSHGTPGGVSEISMSLPVFSQTDRSNSILKDVLNPKP